MKARLVAVYVVLAIPNGGAWLWALAGFHNHPAMLGVSLVIYGLGLRHAVAPFRRLRDVRTTFPPLAA